MSHVTPIAPITEYKILMLKQEKPADTTTQTSLYDLKEILGLQSTATIYDVKQILLSFSNDISTTFNKKEKLLPSKIEKIKQVRLTLDQLNQTEKNELNNHFTTKSAVIYYQNGEPINVKFNQVECKQNPLIDYIDQVISFNKERSVLLEEIKKAGTKDQLEPVIQPLLVAKTPPKIKSELIEGHELIQGHNRESTAGATQEVTYVYMQKWLDALSINATTLQLEETLQHKLQDTIKFNKQLHNMIGLDTFHIERKNPKEMEALSIEIAKNLNENNPLIMFADITTNGFLNSPQHRISVIIKKDTSNTFTLTLTDDNAKKEVCCNLHQAQLGPTVIALQNTIGKSSSIQTMEQLVQSLGLTIKSNRHIECKSISGGNKSCSFYSTQRSIKKLLLSILPQSTAEALYKTSFDFISDELQNHNSKVSLVL